MVVDAYALIVQQDADGGDTLQREGMYAFGKWLIEKNGGGYVIKDPPERDPKTVMDKLEVAPGVYVRHPDPTKWYSNPATTSRDQLIPVIAYAAAYKDYSRLWRLFRATAGRGFFAQNFYRCGENESEWKVPDTMIGHLGLFIRAGGWYTALLYPLLLITDTLELLANLVEQIPLHWEESTHSLRWRNMGDVHDNNTIIGILLAAEFKPTPISWLNRQLYSVLKAKNYGNVFLGEENHVMGSLAWYHRADAGGSPEMAELYRPSIEKYFSAREDLRYAWNDLKHQFVDPSRSVASSK
jgi:hypothetical protein